MKITKFQQGGQAPAPQEGGEQGGGSVEELATQIVQQLGPEGAMALAEAIVAMVQGGGGQAPAPEQGPAPAYAREGGKLVRVNG